MARKAATLPKGTRLTDLIGLGVLTQYIPLRKVDEALEATQRQSQRHRQLPARVMVYYVLALALYMEVNYGEVLRCLVEGLARLGLPVQRIRQSARSSISQARRRLGSEPLKLLYETLGDSCRERADPGSLVPAVAAGQRGWQHPGSTRYRAERSHLRPAGSLAGAERVSATALCLSGREWDPHPVWGSGGRVQDVGGATGSGGVGSTPARHVVPGRPWLFQLPVVAAGYPDRGRLGLACQKQSAPAGAAALE